MIHKTIHQIVGPNTTPLIEYCLASWKPLEKYGFSIIVWDDLLIEDFIRNHHPFALDTFLNARNYAEAADIARYLFMFTKGGFYIDWDVQLLNEHAFIDLATKYSNGYMLVDYTNNTLAPEFIYAKKGDIYFMNLVYDIVEIYNSGKRDQLSTPKFSGPYRMRDSLEKHKITNMSIIDVKEAFVYDYNEIRVRPPRKIDHAMVHYWAHTWL